MRPNGRTIYKVLMKGRQSVLWGRRAFVTVRLPVSVLPVPRPPIDYCKDWGTEIAGGMWEKELGDGVSEFRYISQLSSGGDPTTFDHEEDDAVIHHLTAETHGDWTSYKWWEGSLRRKNEDGTVDERSELPVEDIDAHRALCEWRAKYLDGVEEADCGPVLQAFLDAANWAKTHYTALSEDGRYLYFTYSIKWFYKNRARGFSADLKRAFRVATEHNINAKLLR